MLNYRYFKGNVLGGFRLVDLNKTVRQGEYFFLDTRTASMSKATAGALKAKWMIEVTAEEANQQINIPTEDKQQLPKIEITAKLATPNVEEINKKSETAKLDHIETVSLPDFKEVERHQKEKSESKSFDTVSTPSQHTVEKNSGIKKEDTVFKDKDTILKKQTIKKDEVTITNLAKEESIVADNSLLSTPKIPQEEKPVRRRRRRKAEIEIPQ